MRFCWVITILLLVSFNDVNTCVDRKLCPEGAIYEAKKSLHRKDLVEYFETLTDKEMQGTLKNSISICSSSKLKEIKQYSYNESRGCEDILSKYGWIEPKYQDPSEITRLWQEAILKIEEPRKMVVELEINHRKNGSGSSFVWSYLDPVKIKNAVVNGDTAYSEVEWHGEEQRILYEKHSSGWRFEVEPWVAH